MGDISTERLERPAPVLEPTDQRQREPGSRPRRRTPPHPPSEPESPEDTVSDAPPHQVDDMA